MNQVSTQEITFWPMYKQAQAIKTGEISSEELVNLYLKRIDKQEDLNAVVAVDREAALQQARKADALQRKGATLGSLHGIPLTVKDAWETQGLRTTAGIPKLSEYIPKKDAPVIANLRKAGAVILGKTNMPTGNLDLQAANPVYGITRNPWDRSKTSGGSAGGAAVAVSAGLSSIDFASEIAGSIRIPAHYCGVYGHKSSFGITYLRGHIPYGPGEGYHYKLDLALGGPISRDAEDLKIALLAAAAPQPEDQAAWHLSLPEARAKTLKSFRVAAWLDDAFCPTGKDSKKLLEETITALEEAGLDVEKNPPIPVSLQEMNQVFDKLLYSAFANYWSDEEYQNMREAATQAQNQAFNYVSKCTTINHREWLEASIKRYEFHARWATFFNKYDILLMPVTPSSALAVHGPEENWFGPSFTLDGQEREYLDQIKWTGPINLINMPSTTMPIGLDSNNMPIGMQIVGPYLHDLTTIEFARLTSEITGGYIQPPQL